MKGRMSNCDKILFFLGLGSVTKIVLFGVLSFSEIFMFIAAPMLFATRYAEFRRGGVLPIVWIEIFMIIGCFVSSLQNDVPIFRLFKEAALYYSLFAATVVYYHYLRRSPSGLKWFLVGAFLSMIISIFVFNPQLSWESSSSFSFRQVDVKEASAGPLFWFPKIMALIRLPITSMYLYVPTCYSWIMLPLGIAITMLISESGRSAAACAICGMFLIVVAGRTRSRMRSLGKHFFLLIAILSLLGLMAKFAYSKAALAGVLGEKAYAKYVMQTRHGNGFLDILIMGRTEFFTTIFACLDNPILGFGFYAEDVKGYRRDFVFKYGSLDEIQGYENALQRTGGVEYLPQHSYLTQFWGECGIFGLIFWVYFIFLALQFFRRYASAIPQWYGYLALGVPATMWAVFFSPYIERTSFPFLLASLLFARAVGRRRESLPFNMEQEIEEKCN